jgi:hypothetical protein
MSRLTALKTLSDVDDPDQGESREQIPSPVRGRSATMQSPDNLDAITGQHPGRDSL